MHSNSFIHGDTLHLQYKACRHTISRNHTSNMLVTYVIGVQPGAAIMSRRPSTNSCSLRPAAPACIPSREPVEGATLAVAPRSLRPISEPMGDEVEVTRPSACSLRPLGACATQGHISNNLLTSDKLFRPLQLSQHIQFTPSQTALQDMHSHKGNRL